MKSVTLFGSLTLEPGVTGFHDPVRGFVCTGAAMGRRNNVPEDTPDGVRLNLRRLPMVDGDYDRGGAYWGGWSAQHGGMWVAWSKADSVRVFVRAKSRDDAAAKVRDVVKGARFVGVQS